MGRVSRRPDTVVGAQKACYQMGGDQMRTGRNACATRPTAGGAGRGRGSGNAVASGEQKRRWEWERCRSLRGNIASGYRGLGKQRKSKFEKRKSGEGERPERAPGLKTRATGVRNGTGYEAEDKAGQAPDFVGLNIETDFAGLNIDPDFAGVGIEPEIAGAGIAAVRNGRQRRCAQARMPVPLAPRREAPERAPGLKTRATGVDGRGCSL